MDIRSFPRPPRESTRAKPVQLGNEANRGSRERKRRRRVEKARRSKVLMFRTGVLGGVALLGLIIVVGFAMLREKRHGAAVWKAPGHGVPEVKSSGFAVPSEEEVVALVRRVLAVRDVKDFGQRLRLDGMSAQEALAFLSGLPASDGQIKAIEWRETTNPNGIQIETVRVSFDRDGQTRSRLAMITPNEAGVWQFDIASFARRQSAPWSEMLAGPGQEHDLRVHAARDSYYNGEYRDEKRWACYSLSSEDMDVLLVGYCPRGGEVDLAMSQVLIGKKAARVILRFARSGGSGSRQGEIKSVLAEDWVRTDTPFDGRLAKESARRTEIETDQAE